MHVEAWNVTNKLANRIMTTTKLNNYSVRSKDISLNAIVYFCFPEKFI